MLHISKNHNKSLLIYFNKMIAQNVIINAHLQSNPSLLEFSYIV